MAYIRNLPLNDTPEIFGLHDNANITFAQNETYEMLEALLKLQPKSSTGGGKSREEVGGGAFILFFYRPPFSLSTASSWGLLTLRNSRYLPTF